MALFLHFKAFAESTMVIALGIMISREKRFLGFVETQMETSQVLSAVPAFAGSTAVLMRRTGCS